MRLVRVAGGVMTETHVSCIQESFVHAHAQGVQRIEDGQESHDRSHGVHRRRSRPFATGADTFSRCTRLLP